MRSGDILGLSKFCLTLPGAAERRELVMRELERAELDETVFTFGADPKDKPELCQKTPGAWGCAAGHVELVRWWLRERPSQSGVIVFEDDVCFCDDFQTRMA